MEESLQVLFQPIQEGNSSQAASSVKQALDSKVDPALILTEGMVKAMGEVGRLFEEGEYFVSGSLNEVLQQPQPNLHH
jgi:5-methyltetrahydrofolate--homocysteine methyltransferase